ncbi:TetR/AcrR family transcriptional regulator [Pseudooceanicola sp. CBS1P-1]|uniref:TetR/AcrR family transcriptional regulator n=1 Tax=Pseudooceanicola TaxID=1679449 RepID=UPI00136A48C8|nr:MULTISPECIES: TetR/AcrR family transcriptional regulator [Pseudooceanicola]MBT9384013.1 TetR/AcrR family transcriptional regulator [Pseudooceanicola endophyticus]
MLEAAARLLERGGPEAVTTNAVAELAGVSIGSLYQYFPGRAAILAELIRATRAALLTDLERTCLEVRTLPLPQAVARLLDVVLAHHLARPARIAALEALEAPLPLAAETAALDRRITGAVAALLAAQGVADPQTAARDLAAITRALIDTSLSAGDLPALRPRLERALHGYLGL